MIIWYQVDDYLFEKLEEIQNKQLLLDKDIIKLIWISKPTYYNVKRERKASIITLRKIIKFLKKNNIEIEIEIKRIK